MREPMKSLQRLLSAALFTLAAASPAIATDFDDPPGGDARFDEGILELLPGVDINEVLARYGFTLLDSIESKNIHLVSFQPALTEDEFELLFFADPQIDHSELNFDTGNSGPNSGSLFFNVAPVAFTEQPVWTVLGANAAHATATGAGTTVAIIDTGIDLANPMFHSNLHPASISFVGLASDIQDAGNGINDDNQGLVDEMVGHGTWVAGIIRYVAPDATLMPIRALNDEGFTDAFTLAKAIYHAAEYGADVINMSLGSIAEVRIVERAVDDVSALGIIPVAAAGNQGIAQPEYPAINNKAVGVAAVELNGRLTDFSNYSGASGSERVLLAAPGVSIVGPILGGYGEASGTSAAAPLVAGTAALLKQLGTIRRFGDFEQMAEVTAIDVSPQNPGLDSHALGEGMLSIDAAVAWAGPCYADLTENGVLDLADLQLFILGFTSGDEDSDYVEPRGVWDLADLQFFIQEFIGGCP